MMLREHRRGARPGRRWRRDRWRTPCLRYAGLRVALGCRDPFGKLLATGVTVLVCGQAAVNIAAVMGVAPLTGIPLPFLSYGGSSLVVLLASVGILLNIAHHGNRATATVRDRSRRDSRPRAASARGRGSAQSTRRVRDVRRVAGSRRSATRSLRPGSSSTRFGSAASSASRAWRCARSLVPGSSCASRLPRDSAPPAPGCRLRGRWLRGRADGACCGDDEDPRGASRRPMRTSGLRTGLRRRSRSASFSPTR